MYFAVRGNNSATIEVRLRPKDAQWRYRLDVFADGQRVYFDRRSLRFQHFPGVVVYSPTYLLNQSEVVVMLDTGAGVEVVENEGFLSARCYLPWNYLVGKDYFFLLIILHIRIETNIQIYMQKNLHEIREYSKFIFVKCGKC